MNTNVIEQLYHQVRAAINEAVVAAAIVEREQLPVFTLEVPKDKQHGDLATNAAMQLTKIAKRNPREIAQAIIQHLDKGQASIESAEIAGPGFINFRFNRSYLYPVLTAVVEQGANYGRVQAGAGQKVQVEFVSANPTGSLHLGHARGAAVGDSLCNLLDFAGYDVSREYYINDAGNQVANLALSLEARYKQALGLEAEVPADGYAGGDIVDFANELAAAQGDALLALPDAERLAFFRAYGLEKELDKIKRDLGRFRVTFDSWFSETSLYEQGLVQDVLGVLEQRGQVFIEEGATWLNTVAYGDDKNRVLQKSDGSYTYLTPDIAYHRTKYERGFDKLINIWGADHHGYIPRVKAAMAGLGNNPEQLVVLLAQMVRLLKDGEVVKMSKRTGNAVTIEELMDEVGVDAMRYFFAMRSTDSQLDFDMDLAISTTNENPVHYVQYAHARICSVYRLAEEQNVAVPSLADVDFSQLTSEYEFDILRKLGEFPQEIAEAAELYAPHRIVRYVYDLAALFHSYYNQKDNRVITDNVAQTGARLVLVGAIRTVLANALRIIGVSARERM